MTFGHPHAFWLLAVVVVGALLDRVKRDQKQLACPRIPRLRAEATRIDFSPQSTQRELRWRLWLGCALLVVALASPRFGFVHEDDVKNSREVVLAIDLSRSMLAKDVKPSRLDHVKLLTSALISKSAGDRFGLLLFSASAYLQLPLSNDYDILADMLPNLSPDYFPVSGTNYEAMLKCALTTFSSVGDAERFLVVLSDGEAFDKNWKAVIPELKARNIHVVGLGVGTPGGGLIPDGNRAVRDANGLEVLTRLEPATLQELATATGGTYQRADSYVDITNLLKATANPAQNAAATKVDETRLVERYRWALFPALVLLALSFWRDFPVHPSMRVVNLPATAAAPKRTARATAVAAAAMFAGVLLLAPRLRSQDASELEEKGPDYKEADAGSPMQMTAKLVTQRINGILTNPKPGANDCVSLVIDIVNYCEQMLRARLRFPVSIIDDARRAVDWGEKLDPQGGDWAMLRKTLDTLLAADIEPWKTTKPDAAGKVAMKLGYEEGTEMKNDRRASRGGPVEDLTNAADLALPLLKLEQVRRADQPARLFQMLEGKKGAAPMPTSPQW
jgi:Ca-activated chloride channel family protein